CPGISLEYREAHRSIFPALRREYPVSVRRGIRNDAVPTGLRPVRRGRLAVQQWRCARFSTTPAKPQCRAAASRGGTCLEWRTPPKRNGFRGIREKIPRRKAIG